MEISKGAEATLYLTDYGGRKVVEKKRHPKEYRIREIDEKIRKERTQRESRLIKKLGRVVSCPELVDVKDYSIFMEYIEGPLAKNYDLEKIAFRVGEMVADMHAYDFIHNDLTTSNIIVRDGAPCFIDFGLSFISKRIEDKAMDLVVFKKILLASHADVFDKVWKLFLDGYRKYELAPDIIARIDEIEKRWRYKER